MWPIDMCSWGCAVPRILSWLPWWSSTLWQSVSFLLFEVLQFVSTQRVLHRLLKICKICDVVVDIWVSIPCTAGAPFRLNNEKLCAETGDLAMTYNLVVATVGGRFRWEWSDRSKLWDLVVVRNLFARCGSSSCLF